MSFLPLCFSQGDLDVCINHDILFSFGYVSGLWSSTVYSLIVSFSVTSTTNDFCVAHLVENSLQIFKTNCPKFFRVLHLLSILVIKEFFCQLFITAFRKSCISVLVFYCCSPNVYIKLFKRLCHIIFKLDSF